MSPSARDSLPLESVQGPFCRLAPYFDVCLAEHVLEYVLCSRLRCSKMCHKGVAKLQLLNSFKFLCQAIWVLVKGKVFDGPVFVC
mmetsp:Transcript_53906/g.144277  ORF Transcript_53906/g.144277 Transcript_53906/m.144277 type:complete len:85 (+) Transcript_53906:278-532(+)